jgi:hypothetical protein
VQNSILSQHGNLIPNTPDCLQFIYEVTESTVNASEICDVFDSTAASDGTAAEESAVTSTAVSNLVMATQVDDSLAVDFRTSALSDAGECNAKIFVQSRASTSGTSSATSPQKCISMGETAAMHRRDLYNWNFDPFTADTLKKCSMLEAMFGVLDVAQVHLLTCFTCIVTRVYYIVLSRSDTRSVSYYHFHRAVIMYMSHVVLVTVAYHTAIFATTVCCDVGVSKHERDSDIVRCQGATRVSPKQFP